MTAALDAHAIAVLGLTVVAFALFLRERVPIQTTSVGILAALTLGFQLFPYERAGERFSPTALFLGFGHEALVAICALMIVGKGLVATGALDPVARGIARLWARSPGGALLAVLLFAFLASGIVNDTPVVVMLMPILLGVAMRTKSAAGRTLLPMNYAVLVGGMATSIGTSTNLLVVSIAADLGMRRFGVFDFYPVAMLAGVAGLVYLWLVLPRLLKGRTSPIQEEPPRRFAASLHLREEGFADGRSLKEIREKTEGRIRIDEIERGESIFLARHPALVLRAGDRIHLSDTPANLKEFEKLLGATLYDPRDLEHPVDQEHPLQGGDQLLVQAVVTEDSVPNRTTLSRLRFSDVYGVAVLALHRPAGRASVKSKDVDETVLQVGDLLLIQGTEERLKEVRDYTGLLMLDETVSLPRSRKAPIAIAVIAGVVGAAALQLVPISIGALAGVAVLVATGCVNWREAGAALSSRVVLLVAASLALGQALTFTGGIDYIASGFLGLVAGMPPAWIASLLMLLMALITNFVSNNAAAAVGTPIAIRIAADLGASPEPFVLAILFGANLCYVTPMAYQTNLLVMSAAGYRFADFVRGGLPLLVIMWATLSLLVPRFFPLF
ncbi:MAG: SLC13 family permease [Burkholderiales bacterium]